MHFFNAAATDYDVIFTANPTAALKLVGEGYPFNKGTTFLLSEDNHNSVNGIQCFAQKKGATVKQVIVLAWRNIQNHEQEGRKNYICFSQYLNPYPSTWGFRV